MQSNPSLPPLPEPRWPMEALAQIAATATVLLSASRVWIALRDRHGAIVSRIAYAQAPEGAPREIAPNSIPQIFADTIRNLAKATASDSAPLALADLHKTPALASQLGPDVAVMRALGSALLIDRGEVIGAIVVTSAQPDSLSGYRRLMLTTFARLAVDTIQMSASVERNKAQAEELDAILSASQALTSTLDPDELFRTIIENIQRVFTFDSALIYRHEKRARRLRVIAAMGEGAEKLTGSTIAEDIEGSRVAHVVRTRQFSHGPIGPADSMGEYTNKLRQGGSAWLLCMPLITKGRLRGVASLARVSAFSPAEVSALKRLSPIIATALENVSLYQQSQAERQQLEALFASASDGIALINEDLLFIQVNAAFARYLATDAESLLGKPVCQALGGATDGSRGPGSCALCDDGPECLVRLVMRTRAQRDHVECEFPPAPLNLPAGGGDSERPSEGPATAARTIDFSLTPMLGPGQRQRLLLVGRDVSSARAFERFRAEQMHLIGHDMRSPLDAIIRNVELLVKLYGARILPEHLPLLRTPLSSAYSISDSLA
ncbi:MAG TPA: GAF domain-containing protein, partial [Ktedonobacterales bacterium]|nr:GAF domain-containing protein [Ktedonobacterales bacterium]